MNPLYWLCVVFSLVIGVGLWYILYGLECFLNGGSLGRDPHLMPFICAWEEFTWLLPGGASRKLKACNNDPEWFAMMPGFWHFFFECVLMPLAPLLLFLFLNDF